MTENMLGAPDFSIINIIKLSGAVRLNFPQEIGDFLISRNTEKGLGEHSHRPY